MKTIKEDSDTWHFLTHRGSKTSCLYKFSLEIHFCPFKSLRKERQCKTEHTLKSDILSWVNQAPQAIELYSIKTNEVAKMKATTTNTKWY